MTNAISFSPSTTGVMTFTLAKEALISLMQGVVGKKTKNKRALSRVHTLIVEAKTEITHNKREAILFDILEELEIELTRL